MTPTIYDTIYLGPVKCHLYLKELYFEHKIILFIVDGGSLLKV